MLRFIYSWRHEQKAKSWYLGLGKIKSARGRNKSLDEKTPSTLSSLVNAIVAASCTTNCLKEESHHPSNSDGDTCWASLVSYSRFMFDLQLLTAGAHLFFFFLAPDLKERTLLHCLKLRRWIWGGGEGNRSFSIGSFTGV